MIPNQCKRWQSMQTLVGCDGSNKNQKINYLCEDIVIDSMFVLEEKVYVFRVDKYWVFELNRQNNDRPLGPLIEGNLKINNKWKGIDGNKNRFTIHDNKIVAISGNKWTEMEPNGDITESKEILSENFEAENGSEPPVTDLNPNCLNIKIVLISKLGNGSQRT